jgi:hypothetical protein
VKANISFGQLINVAPTLRKQFKEGATVLRAPKVVGVGQVNKVEPLPILNQVDSNLEE